MPTGRGLRPLARRTQLRLLDCVHTRIGQNTFDALSSHAHNVGVGNTCASRAPGLINAGRLQEGCRALAFTPGGAPNWSYVTGPDGTRQFVQGLHNRRQARAAERTINKTYVEALNEARTREARLRADADHLRRVSDGLREQGADAARRIAGAAPAAVSEYAAALGAVYDDCRAAYGDMAEKAAGHAADVRTFIEAWPVEPGRALTKN